jgi:signal transduction histidine kinase
MSLKYRIALTVFLLEAVMMAAVVWQLYALSPPSGATDARLEQVLDAARDRMLIIAAFGMSLIALAGLAIGFLLTRRLESLAQPAGPQAFGETSLRIAQALEQRMAFEDLIVRLSARLIGLRPDEIDTGLNDALGEIGRFAGVDRSYVFEFSADMTTESCTHEWCAEGVEPAIHRLQNLPLGQYPWFMARIGRGEVLHVPQVSALPPAAAAERAEFEAEGIQSVIMVPLVFEGRVTGYMGFDAVRQPVEWPEDIVKLLRITGEIVFNALHRKRSETALRNQAQALEHANTALARSNEELKQFAYIASHDLREPLRAIAGFSALLAQRYSGRLDQDADEYIRFITDAASRMHNMINDLLGYSRLDTQAEPLGSCDMNQMLVLAQSNLLAPISEHHARITHDDLPLVQADATQIIQLLQNLIGNAIKFHGAEPPQVHVSAQRRGGEWLFAVRDNGIGIDPRHADTVFHIFKRLHTSDRYPGTGIGLAVCKRIVERHGGRIWVEPNQPGPGTTFYFTLPANGAA